MNNMLTLGKYFDSKKEYLERVNKLYLIKNIEDYGISNAISDIFLSKSITGIDGINGLIKILESDKSPMTEGIIESAKRKYLSHLLYYYFNESLETFYDKEKITDQDIDSGTTKAITSVSNYVINQQASRSR